MAADETAGTAAAQDKPNVLFIWGDDIGWSNISVFNLGIMGYQTLKTAGALKRLEEVESLDQPMN